MGLERVKKEIEKLKNKPKLIISEKELKTADLAADYLNCRVDQIANSLILKDQSTERAYLVISKGGSRIDEKLLSQIIGGELKMGKPDFVKKITGFEVGGVAPIGHKFKLKTYIDKDLLKYEEVFTGGGIGPAILSWKLEELIDVTKAEIISVR